MNSDLAPVPALPSTDLRIVTYNIHKGVQGLGPAKRLEIHNLKTAIEHLDADVICLQEVRGFNTKHAKNFKSWPNACQSEYLAPPGYYSVYKTNAVTKHGEHGNALLSKWPIVGHFHEDLSDHAFEQRGLLHGLININQILVHVIVLHLGLLGGSRKRQIAGLMDYIKNRISPKAPILIAGDFNDWGNSLMPVMQEAGLTLMDGVNHKNKHFSNIHSKKRLLTFPSKLPLLKLDYVYSRGINASTAYVLSGGQWRRLSDHLPLVVEFKKDELDLFPKS